MLSYYKERAPVYDRVYHYVERQDDLRFLEKHVPEVLRNKNVLEIAAGTGYWTQYIAAAVKSLLVTDGDQAPLDELTRRRIDHDFESRLLDAYHLDRLVDEGKSFTGAFAGCWLSHVPKQRMNEFFCALHQCLEPGAIVVLLDNSKAQLDRLPIAEFDEADNGYQHRVLDSGATHRVLKNFPTLDELKSYTEPFGEFQHYIDLENYWLFQYTHKR